VEFTHVLIGCVFELPPLRISASQTGAHLCSI